MGPTFKEGVNEIQCRQQCGQCEEPAVIVIEMLLEICLLRKRVMKQHDAQQERNGWAGQQENEQEEVPVCPALPPKQYPPLKRDEQEEVCHPHEVDPVGADVGSALHESTNANEKSGYT